MLDIKVFEKPLSELKKLDTNQSKLLLAKAAVLRLALPDQDPWTRNELFAPPSNIASECPELRKQGLAKQWQHSFLLRLVELGLVAHHTDKSSFKYTGADAGKLLLLMSIDPDESIDDLRLKQLLWPNKYPDDELDDGEELEEDKTSPAVPSAGEMSIIKEVVEQLTTLATYLKSVADSFQTHDQLLSSINAHLVDVKAMVTEVRDSALETHGYVKSAVDRMMSEERQLLLATATNVVEAAARRKSLFNQLEVSTRKDEKLLGDIEKIVQSTKERING